MEDQAQAVDCQRNIIFVFCGEDEVVMRAHGVFSLPDSYWQVHYLDLNSLQLLFHKLSALREFGTSTKQGDNLVFKNAIRYTSPVGPASRPTEKD